MERGEFCDICRIPFTGKVCATDTTCLWDRSDDVPGVPDVLFAHKDCLNRRHDIDLAYICCGGGAWSIRRPQFESVDRMMKDNNSYRDAGERYKAFLTRHPAALSPLEARRGRRAASKWVSPQSQAST